MEINLGSEILKLIQKSQTTVMKLYHFVNGYESMPTPQEFKKFRDGLIASIKRKNENALKLFPIIKYFENKKITDVDLEYDNILFSVPEDEKIAIASPIEVLDDLPEEGSYDLSINWDLASINERESRVFTAAENYFNIIKNDESLKKFVKYIGTSDEKNWELLEQEKDLFLENVPQEVFALYQSGDLNNLLPFEIMQLDDPDFETVFLKNLIETKLLTYQLWGVEREMYEEWVMHVKDKGDIGPLFICLDTSGSMRGLTEVISKALTMFVCNELENHHKDIIFVPFSMESRYYDLQDSKNKLKKIKLLLKKSYYGGTTLDRTLEVVNSLIHKHRYKKANVLIISDFIFKNFDHNTAALIKRIKQSGHKFHALNVSESKFNNKITKQFNSYWSYTFNWKGVGEGNEEELLTQLTLATENAVALIENVQTFGIIKKLKDYDFIKSDQESEKELELLKSKAKQIIFSDDEVLE